MKSRVLMLLIFFLGIFSLMAQEPGDVDENGRVYLGAMTVNFRVDQDILRVGLLDGFFKKIQIEVEGNDLELMDLKVTFGNGRTQDIRVRHVFREDSRSREIDLRGAARIIRNIRVKYRSIGRLRDGRALMHFYGIR